MKPIRALSPVLVLLLAACAADPAAEPRASASPSTSAADAPNLAGTSWRLVEIAMGDGVTRPAIDRSVYTIGFGDAGVLHVRFDCNRGRGTWQSSAPNNLEFGPLALTRAACPPGSLHDQLVRQWPHVRSYVVRDGRLFLSLMADGGIIEFEPAP